MPSTSTSFLYSLLTMMIVGLILTSSVAQYVGPLRSISEEKRLIEILVQTGSKVEEALVMAIEHDATASIVFRLPSTIGNRHYWIRLTNDSSSAWLEGAFGDLRRSEGQVHQVFLSRVAAASGEFEGRFEFVIVNCSRDDSARTLVLDSQR